MVEVGDFQKAIELINSSSRVLLTSHTRPDGDACGSVRARRPTSGWMSSGKTSQKVERAFGKIPHSAGGGEQPGISMRAQKPHVMESNACIHA